MEDESKAVAAAKSKYQTLSEEEVYQVVATEDVCWAVAVAVVVDVTWRRMFVVMWAVVDRL